MKCTKMLDIVIRYIHAVYQLLKWVAYRVFTNGDSDSMACLAGKTAIVTGGNSGLGYAVSTMLASRGCRVIIADVADTEKTRKEIIERTSNKNVTGKHLDLSSLKSVRKFAEEINKEEDKIDILVNNAGVGISNTPSTEDGLNLMMQINFFGPFLLTHLLVERLKASKTAKVIFTGCCMTYLSRLSLDNMKDIFNLVEYEPDIYNGYTIYQNAKLCNILAAQEFADKLRKYNIIVCCADPGMVRSKLYDSFLPEIIQIVKVLYSCAQFIAGDSFQGAQTIFHVACNENLKDTGKYFYRCRPFSKPKILEDRTFCNRIWKRTEDLVKLSPKEKI